MVEKIPHGQGILTNNIGTKFIGNFVFGQITDGRINYIEGNCYKGEIKNSKPDGKGAITYDDGSSYNGDFQNG